MISLNIFPYFSPFWFFVLLFLNCSKIQKAWGSWNYGLTFLFCLHCHLPSKSWTLFTATIHDTFFLLHFVRTLDLEPLWAAGIQTSDVSSSYLSVFLNHCSDCRLIVNAQLELLCPCEAIFFLSSGLNFGCKTLWRWHQDKPYETDILIIQCVVWLIVFV